MLMSLRGRLDRPSPLAPAFRESSHHHRDNGCNRPRSRTSPVWSYQLRHATRAAVSRSNSSRRSETPRVRYPQARHIAGSSRTQHRSRPDCERHCSKVTVAQSYVEGNRRSRVGLPLTRLAQRQQCPQLGDSRHSPHPSPGLHRYPLETRILLLRRRRRVGQDQQFDRLSRSQELARLSLDIGGSQRGDPRLGLFQPVEVWRLRLRAVGQR